MKYFLQVLFVVLVPFAAFAGNLPKNPYYGDAFYKAIEQGTQDSDLIFMLNKILKSTHKPIGYGQAKAFLLSNYYLVQDGKGYAIKDVYCEKIYPVPGPHAVPNAEILNIEHTWPQSRFTGKYPKDIQKADMHHLFPTDSQLNSTRGNHPFGEVARPKTNLKCGASKFGTPNGRGELVFQPPRAHLGNVARALFYFSVRYEMQISQSEEAYLRKWHQEDPVDGEEEERNQQIFEIQKDRNPFVDYPELVEAIDNF